MKKNIETLESVKKYYGKILQGTRDLKTNACCSPDEISRQHNKILSMIDDEILSKFYGCGSPIPPALKGCTVLDLGCGSGRDVYLVSGLVGLCGQSIGIDMTDEQLSIAKRHINSQTNKFGYKKPNVIFKKGYIEDLKNIGIRDNSIDVVISNCVINLSPAKERVFSEIFRVLKPGGELYFSDVFSGRRVPERLKNDEVLYGECLSGALYIEDFRRLLQSIGCLDFRIISKREIRPQNEILEKKLGDVNFYSMTIRAFKLDNLEDICEDYGQAAMYKGSIQECPHNFVLDEHHSFIKNKPMRICGNTASMLLNTRYKNHFKIMGSRKKHFGPFDCNQRLTVEDKIPSSESRCC